jgi:hypothetical protein
MQDGKETNGLAVRDGEPWSAAGVLSGTSARSHSPQRKGKGTNEDSVGFWPQGADPPPPLLHAREGR